MLEQFDEAGPQQRSPVRSCPARGVRRAHAGHVAERPAVTPRSPHSMPSVRPMAANTSSGSRSALRSTKNTPPSNRSTCARAASTASRVLPVPPGPTSVTSRTRSSPSNAPNSSSAASRPRNVDGGAGRFDGARSATVVAGIASKRSVRRTARSSSRRSRELGRRRRTACRTRCPHPRAAPSISASRGLHLRCGPLHIDESRHSLRKQELVLEARDRPCRGRPSRSAASRCRRRRRTVRGTSGTAPEAGGGGRRART